MDSIDTKLQIIKVNNPFDKRKRIILSLPFEQGESIQDISRRVNLISDCKYTISINGKVQHENWDKIFPENNNQIVFIPKVAGIEAMIIMYWFFVVMPSAAIYGYKLLFEGESLTWAGVGQVFTGGHLMNLLAPSPQRRPIEDLNVASFGWNPATTQRQGLAVAKIYGKIKVYGNIIAAFTSIGVDDDTKQWLHTIIGLGHGPIESITNIKINKRLIEGFTYVSEDVRYGTIEQEVMRSFEDAKIEYNIAAIATFDNPAVWTTIGNYFDQLEIGIVFPYGIHNGVGGNSSISYKIETRKVPYGSWVTLFDGNTGTRAETNTIRALKILTGTDRDYYYDIRLSKTSADDANERGDTIQLDLVREIIEEEQLYPKTTLVGITALATNELSGSLDFSCICKGAIVKVYDSTTETWSLKHSANPAWVLWDILTQPVISGGDPVTFDPDALADDALVAWFKLDDDEANTDVDEEIASHNGIARQNSSVLTTTGYRNKAFNFARGAGDYITLPDSDDNTVLDLTGDLTIGIHFYPNDLDSNLFSNRVDFYQKEYGYHVQTDENGTIIFTCGGGVSDRGEAANAYSTDKIKVSEWNWILVTKEGTRVKFYINGVFAGSDIVADETIAYHEQYTSAKERYIGASFDQDGQTYNGLGGFGDEQYTDGIIDNVKVWNRALTREEVRSVSRDSAYAIARYDGVNPSRLDLDAFSGWADWCDDFIVGDKAVLCIDNITKATQAHVTTILPVKFDIDDIVIFTNIKGMTEITDNTTAVVTEAVGEYEFVIDLDTSGYTAFTKASNLICHFDGTNDSQIILNSSCKDQELTAVDSARLRTAVKKFGTSSLMVDVYQDYVYTSNNSDWDFFENTTDDWTISFFFYPNASGDRDWFIGQYTDSDNYWRMYDFVGLSYTIRVGGVYIASAGGGAGAHLDISTWSHVALIKVGDKIGLYLDGVQVSYELYSDAATFNEPLAIGGVNLASRITKGYMDELRFVKANVYNATPNATPDDTITVPTEAYDDTSRVTEAEHRLDFNGVFDTSNTSVWESTAKVCEMGRAVIVMEGTTYSLVINKAANPEQIFTVGNIGQDSFEERFLSQTSQAAELEIFYQDEDQDFERTPYTTLNPNILIPTNKISLDIFGMTKASQIKRRGTFLLLQNQYIIRTLKFNVDIDSLPSVVGEVIGVQHDVPNWGEIGTGEQKYGGGGRIIQATMNTVTVDRPLAFDPNVGGAVTYEILIRYPDDTFEVKTITAYDESTRAITISGSFTTLPQEGDVWAVGKENLVTQEYRILRIERNMNQQAKLTVAQYEDEVYAND